MSEVWSDVIGNLEVEIEIKNKAKEIIKALEFQKIQIDEEEEKYRNKWNGLFLMAQLLLWVVLNIDVIILQ